MRTRARNIAIGQESKRSRQPPPIPELESRRGTPPPSSPPPPTTTPPSFHTYSSPLLPHLTSRTSSYHLPHILFPSPPRFRQHLTPGRSDGYHFLANILGRAMCAKRGHHRLPDLAANVRTTDEVAARTLHRTNAPDGLNELYALSALNEFQNATDFCTSIIDSATCILRRCVPFISNAPFHVASGIKCAPGLGTLLPDRKAIAQGSRPQYPSLRTD